jgi:hypothetical protein
VGIEGIEVVADKLLNVYVGSDDQDLYAFGLTGGGMKTATQRPDPKTLRPDFDLEVSKPDATPSGEQL